MSEKKLRVLADFHHAGLLSSLIMLFEGRLGGELYRPIGMEWADEGFWHVYDHPATQAQYLSLAQGFQPVDGTAPLNNVTKFEEDIYYCQDIDSGYYNKAITLAKFASMEFDLIIASLPQHIEPFKKLIELYQPQAKLIFQVGNQWDGIDAPNIMASAKLTGIPENINSVEYHQEFDLKKFNPFDRDFEPRSISSFINLTSNTPDYQTLLQLEQEMPDYRVFIHGAMGRDLPIDGSDGVAKAMRFSQFLWQVKAGGDGYGHILFNSAACGVPTIVKKSYYANKLGEKLLIDEETCIDIDGLNGPQIIEKIRKYSDPAAYQWLSDNVYRNFTEKVDFDEDETKIRAFLDRLQ